MKERGIVCAPQEVRAILDGTKTQLRRDVKLRMPPSEYEVVVYPGNGPELQSYGNPDADDFELYYCPYGVVGDRLWVRETWARSGEVGDETEYRADNPDPSSAKWRPSIHMPRWASRITLEITDVRVQRLQDISEEDANAEGFESEWHGVPVGAVEAFSKLWDEIHGPGAWAKNPFVWAITFKQVQA